jgi:hypothetical protein
VSATLCWGGPEIVGNEFNHVADQFIARHEATV